MTFAPTGWSEELVREAWDNDMEGACEKAGIDVGMTTEGAVNGEDSLYTSLSVHRVRNVFSSFDNSECIINSSCTVSDVPTLVGGWWLVLTTSRQI